MDRGRRFDGGCLLGGKLTRHVGFTDTLDLTRFMTAAGQQGQGQQGQGQQGPAASSNGSGGGGGGGSGSGHHHHHQEHGHHHHTHHQHHHGGQHHGQHQQQQHGPHPHPHQPHDPGRSVYNLTGVLVHQGSSLHSGHYYAFVRDAGDRWALMNDSAVTPLASFAEVSREQAYMLFYTRTTMKRPREPPPPAPPPPAAAAAAEAGVAAAGKAAAGVYGPQLPPGFARAASAPAAVAAAAAANGGGGGGSAASSAVSSGGSGGGQGLGALGSGRAVMPAAPTARLAARPSGSVAAAAAAPSTAKLPAKFTITARASLDRAPSAAAAADSAGEAAGPGPGRGTRSAPLTPAATTSSASAAAANAASASASEADAAGGAADAADTASPAAGDGLAGRKRKRPEASSSTGAAANGTAADGPCTGLTELPPGATASERRRAAVEAEVAAHKACASWGEGVKRLKGAMGGMLRRSEWAAAAAALMRSLKSSGLSLQEVVALPRSDERRRELNRVVPRGVLEHGRDELARLLRAALLQLGWLGLGASGSLLL
ncbi:hypothetical protein CHLRE_01g010800v5 [Chlamydomonas reinhardtii]|uniref:ubiquitinyl hydrolase 1 n=1 Tax=Chlamydomonas reinhardtii TaxID=3055 RepID=A0A2K3E5E1_CHLRE|nr:uncharacterized protein CHLRE_01g010800v5 [Chlamydomonas reinhardtii]PNW88012.1 hypothetical protein CHLRE_01g010800v5 [Chlamydomonas reinhardtii]